MKKLLFAGAILLIANGIAVASCGRVNESEIKSMDKTELHKTLCSYYKKLNIEVKNTNNQIKAGRSSKNENQEFCQAEIKKIELVFSAKFKKIPECP